MHLKRETGKNKNTVITTAKVDADDGGSADRS